MMPNPEDAFDDENAPPIPDLPEGERSFDPKSEEEQKEFEDKQEEALRIIQDSGGMGELRDKRREASLARGIALSQSSGGGTEQLLEEVRAIRSAIEALLNS